MTYNHRIDTDRFAADHAGRYAAMRRLSAICLLLFASSAYATELPCGIASLKKVGDGIVLQFKKTQFWRFSHSNGDWGAIGLLGVAIFERKGVALGDPLMQPELHLQLNEHIVLGDHHDSCRLLLIVEGQRLALKASGGFSYPGLKPTSFETTVHP